MDDRAGGRSIPSGLRFARQGGSVNISPTSAGRNAVSTPEPPDFARLAPDKPHLTVPTAMASRTMVCISTERSVGHQRTAHDGTRTALCQRAETALQVIGLWSSAAIGVERRHRQRRSAEQSLLWKTPC